MQRRVTSDPPLLIPHQGSPNENPILLVSGATRTVAALAPHPRLGQFVTPRTKNDISLITAAGHAWAADNDALAGLDPDAYLGLLDQIAAADRTHLKFVAVPDDAQMTPDGPRVTWVGTLALWRSWRRALIRRDLPAAIVLQDGATSDTVPWDDLAAVFLGGSTAFKESDHARALLREAGQRGLWRHVGRINTLRRYWLLYGAFDSYDGSGFSQYPSRIAWMLRATSQRRMAIDP